MKRLVSISAASLVMVAAAWLTQPSAEAQWQGINEKTWAESIQSAIRDKASAQEICTNSRKFATASKEEAFKDWAYSIAKKYCTVADGRIEAVAPVSKKEEQCHLDSSDIYLISIGEKIRKQGKECWASFN